MLYRRILALLPAHPGTLYNLCLIEADRGDTALASQLLHRAVAGGLDPASALIGQATLARVAQEHEAAAGLYRKMLECEPDSPEALEGLAGSLIELGRLAEAEKPARRLAEIMPSADADNNLGSLLHEMGRRQEAKDCFERALSRAPDRTAILNNLGNLLRDLGQIDQARACYQRAHKLEPATAEPLHNLADLEWAGGKTQVALLLALEALKRKETARTRQLVGHCLSEISAADIPELRSTMVRALKECWIRPDDLAASAARMALSGPVAQVEMADRPAILDLLPALSQDDVLITLLVAAPVTDTNLERYLTEIRRVLLSTLCAEKTLPADSLRFVVGLAQQCFINEYVFSLSAEEAGSASQLAGTVGDALGRSLPMDENQVAVLACYQSLKDLPGADRLVEKDWSEVLRPLMDLAVRNPLREARLRPTIPPLTAIGPGLSEAARRHYEENPYPRWVQAETPIVEAGLASAMRRAFPHADLAPLPEHGQIDILIAGCGTGQQAVEMARRFPCGRITAFDLSLSSLAYAKRQAEDLALKNLHFLHGDILQIDGLTQQYDLVSCTGVLVLMADPFAAWQSLNKRLKPGGILQLALYSAIARKPLAAAQACAAKIGGLHNADMVRRLRETLRAENGDRRFDLVLDVQDFYTVSGCRDMLSAVRENQFALPEIRDFMRKTDLNLLGFQLLPAVLHQFSCDNPQGNAMTDLDAWQRFEEKHPDTFLRMYQFWMQRGALPAGL